MDHIQLITSERHVSTSHRRRFACLISQKCNVKIDKMEKSSYIILEVLHIGALLMSCSVVPSLNEIHCEVFKCLVCFSSLNLQTDNDRGEEKCLRTPYYDI